MKKTIAVVLAVGLTGCASAQDTCHPVSELSCSPELSCAEYFDESHAVPVVCERVTPAGNCRPLDEFTPDHSASCGGVSGDVWCCGPDSDASCLPFDDAACDGPSLADVTGTCEATFGASYAVPRTCLPADGPGGCKNLSRMSQDPKLMCGGESRDLWCCSGQ